MVLEYMIYATNNKEMVMNDMIGATCIYCFKNPIIVTAININKAIIKVTII